ncbi:MAG: terpene cyclase/mutase family protein [Planctomycetes bacterium]|nr:terpene cyclase/mutase family protein [Planctomycetota bacterium]
MRRLLLPLFLGAALPLLALAAPGVPADKDDPGIEELSQPAIDAVDTGLAFLATRQRPNGSLGADFEIAITSLAGLSFLADGSVPGRGKYGENVRKALDFILGQSQKSVRGEIRETDNHSRMHGHGYATLFLAEAYGMSGGVPGLDGKLLHRRLQLAVQVIREAQTKDGGWGYDFRHVEFDEASVTVCAVQALRAARDAGIAVPKKVIDDALEYVRRCAKNDGSFMYSLKAGIGRSSFALTAAAISVLVYGGDYSAPQIQPGLDYMASHRPGGVRNDSQHYFYESYYAALAMYYAGGTHWSSWYPVIRDELLARQDLRQGRDRGAWSGEYGQEYCTAFATLILQIPKRYLPIFQR